MSESTAGASSATALSVSWRHFSAAQVLSESLRLFGTGRIVLASSFGPEDQVLTDMILSINPGARIFTLDTGRLFQETYDVWQATCDRYGVQIESFAPSSEDLAQLTSGTGPNLFYNSIALRKRCCELRKIQPLKRALSTADAWICGLRREQSITRDSIDIVENDTANNVIKINPLVNWTENEVWNWIHEKKIPYSRLFDQGFRSVGCAPCTRAVKEGEDPRAGRWWWEEPGHKECGLHKRSGQ